MIEFMTAALGFILAMLALGLIRVLRGPDDADRMMAAQLIGNRGNRSLAASRRGDRRACDGRRRADPGAPCHLRLDRIRQKRGSECPRIDGGPMSLALDIMTIIAISAGAFFFLAGTVGWLRFPDTLTRLHALTKADNVGLDLVVLGLLPQAGTYAAGSSRSASGCSCWPRERRSPSSLRAPPMICSVFIRFPTPCLPERPRRGLPRQRFGRRKPRRSSACPREPLTCGAREFRTASFSMPYPCWNSWLHQRAPASGHRCCEHGGSSGSTRALCSIVSCARLSPASSQHDDSHRHARSSSYATPSSLVWTPPCSIGPNRALCSRSLNGPDEACSQRLNAC